MHGIFAGPSEFNDFRNFTNKVHPGTNFTVIDAYNDWESLAPLSRQVDHIRPTVLKVMKEHPEGVHLMCFSQGGLVCRGLIETLPDHNIDTFIALSTPQGGQYGDTSYVKKVFPHSVKEDLYELFYSGFGQDISIANYWNDPHHQDLYRKYTYVALLNNQTHNPHSEQYKANFLRLKNVVLIGGPDDGVITPWQSSQFGAYNDKDKVVSMHDQEWYKKDSFGLRSLDQRGSLHIFTVPGIEHTRWHKELSVFQCCVQKWLT